MPRNLCNQRIGDGSAKNCDLGATVIDHSESKLENAKGRIWEIRICHFRWILQHLLDYLCVYDINDITDTWLKLMCSVKMYPITCTFHAVGY